jgi:hypothetical protein
MAITIGLDPLEWTVVWDYVGNNSAFHIESSNSSSSISEQEEVLHDHHNHITVSLQSVHQLFV